MTVVAVVNQKGGSSTRPLGLASAANAHGIDTLVVDLYPKCNVSEALGIEYPLEGRNAADLLAQKLSGSAVNAVHASKWNRVNVIPSDLDLADLDAVSGLGVEQRLRATLDSDEMRDR